LAKFSRNTGFAKDVREDKAGRESFNTVFGDKIVVERLADVEEQFHYNISTSTLTTTVVASGTATSDADMAKLSTGSGTSASDQALRHGHFLQPYFPMVVSPM
jgi:hypothetical protein